MLPKQMMLDGDEVPVGTWLERVRHVMTEYPETRSDDDELVYRFQLVFDRIGEAAEMECQCPACGHKFPVSLLDRFRVWSRIASDRDTICRRRREIHEKRELLGTPEVMAERKRKSKAGFRW